MFTGIVAHTGKILTIDQTAERARLVIATEFPDLQLGESISVDGACLTVTAFSTHQFSCELSLETLQRTTASAYHVGRAVNLERAMSAQDRFGGHFVSGHVDQTAIVAHIKNVAEFRSIEFTGINSAQCALLIEKGSVAVNGVSLTINLLSEKGFDVMLIPHTLSLTNLSELSVGDRVNIEFDQIAKMVQKITAKHVFN